MAFITPLAVMSEYVFIAAVDIPVFTASWMLPVSVYVL